MCTFCPAQGLPGKDGPPGRQGPSGTIVSAPLILTSVRIGKLPQLSSKLCLLFIHCSVNSPVSASSVAPQGTPGAPGAPGSPGPQGKQGELGPPVSLASRLRPNSRDLALMLLSPVGPRPRLTSRQEVMSVRLSSFLSDRYCF